MNRYKHRESALVTKSARLKKGKEELYAQNFPVIQDCHLLYASLCLSAYCSLLPPHARLSTALVLPTGPAFANLESQFAKKPKNPV